MRPSAGGAADRWTAQPTESKSSFKVSFSQSLAHGVLHGTLFLGFSVTSEITDYYGEIRYASGTRAYRAVRGAGAISCGSAGFGRHVGCNFRAKPAGLA